MKIKDLFTLHQGNSLDLIHLETVKDSNINFISRTAQNNGVVAQVGNVDDIEPFPAGYITVALGGSILSSFVQLKPFYTAFHIMVLEPKKKMSLQEKLYYCMCIKANAYRYGYGRQANRTLKDIELPDNIPKWVCNTSIKPIDTKIKQRCISPFRIDTWKEFLLGDLFTFHKGCRLTKQDMVDGQVNFLGAISENNGVRQKIDIEPMYEPNCITVNYNGSVGEAFYQQSPFWASDDVNVLYANGWTLNKHIAMFIATVIKANRYMFSYGRKWTLDKMKKSSIKLPVTAKGSPDWDYMEKYIKFLPYSDKI